jgi:hypothetical protein
MDELDRMFRRLVHNVRAGFPDLLTRPFEVAALHQHLIPYRLNRRELGIDSAEEYELTLIRLLAGTRGLLEGDPEMQAALRAELESPNPDLSTFRAFGTASISIAPAALRTLDSQAAAPRTAEPAAATRQAEMAGRATQELPTSGSGPAVARTAAAPRAAVPVTRATGPGCRYCGGDLPEGRDVHFCPHCGQNLSIKQCPACSTELEVEWQFCITCGRQVD